MNVTISRFLAENNGTLPAFTFPGSYPFVYLDRDNNQLCHDCAQDRVKHYLNAPVDEKYLCAIDMPVAYIMIDEGEIFCCSCDQEIGAMDMAV